MHIKSDGGMCISSSRKMRRTFFARDVGSEAMEEMIMKEQQ